MSLGMENPRAVAYLKAHGADLVAGIDDTTKKRIRAIIANGVAEGKTYDEMEQELIDLYEEFAIGKPQQHILSRAHGIVYTESGMAYEEGNAMVAADLKAGGVEMEKHWQTMEDDRVTDECRANQDEGWIPIDRAHRSGHMQPLARPYCRCAELYRRVGAGAGEGG